MAGGYMKQNGGVVAFGNLTRDPEQRETTSSGKTAPVKASIAVGEGETTRYVNLIAWYEIGEKLKVGSKGDRVVVFGNEKDSSYTNKEGDVVAKTEVDCFAVFLHRRAAPTNRPPVAPAPPTEDMEEIDDDMPF